MLLIPYRDREAEMKKSEMVEQIAEKAQTSKAAAARVLDAIFDSATGTIAEAVRAGQQVSIPGFGKFKPKKRPARKGRNPKTGAEIDIPERTVVAFSAGKGLRDTLETPTAGKRRTQSAATAAKGDSKGAKQSGGKQGSRATGAPKSGGKK